MAHPLEDPFVLLQGPGAHPTGEDDNGRLGNVFEGGVGGEAEHAVLTADLAALMADEDHIDMGMRCRTS